MSSTTPRYRIVLCEIYNEYIHGPSDNPMMNSQYLIIGKFNPYYDSYYSDDSESASETESGDEGDDYDADSLPIDEMMGLHADKYRSEFIRYTVRYKHPFIRNYRRIVLRPTYIKPEIAKCIILQSGESVAILKTFWLRIVQRAWKRVFSERNALIKKRCSPDELYYKERRGKWSCSMHGLRGMLRFTTTTTTGVVAAPTETTTTTTMTLMS